MAEDAGDVLVATGLGWGTKLDVDLIVLLSSLCADFGDRAETGDGEVEVVAVLKSSIKSHFSVLVMTSDFSNGCRSRIRTSNFAPVGLRFDASVSYE